MVYWNLSEQKALTALATSYGVFPIARWGTPEDLMGPAVFLASDASDFVNGHILYVDGGILAYLGRNPRE